MLRVAANTNDVFHAIADPTRRAILDRLRDGPTDSGTLAANFPLSWPAVSKHLRELREVRLVVDVRAGRRRIYAVDALPLRSVAGWLECYSFLWQTTLAELKRSLEANERNQDTHCCSSGRWTIVATVEVSDQNNTMKLSDRG
jgi:DNA-binding transcriptional ArsR family regulator